jgi:putative phage-type endonuclease
MLSKTDEEELLVFFLEALDAAMKSNPDSISQPDFHNFIENHLMEVAVTIFQPIFDEELEEDIMEFIPVVMKNYFRTIMPRRQFRTSFTNRKSSCMTNKRRAYLTEKINYLRSIPQPEQRTNDWYLFRHNLLTASNAWKGLSSEKLRNSLIYEKCCPIDTKKYAKVAMDSPFHWGTKYEPLSVQFYEHMYATKVEDFGCIQDQKHSFLGASPDGINVCPKSDRYGRMLEIKNRFSDAVPITGIPKRDYWIQMQLQMNVCELNECDFLETRFIEYEDEEAFLLDVPATSDTHTQPEPEPDQEIKETDYKTWELQQFEEQEAKGNIWVKNLYWYLSKYSCVLVLRNKIWFTWAAQTLSDVWNTIETERDTGYEHRAPKKRERTSSNPNPNSKAKAKGNYNDSEVQGLLGKGVCLI